MAMATARTVAIVIGFGLVAGCSGGTLGAGADGGQDGSSPNQALCAPLDECGCWAALDRCTPRTEACWCPDRCAAVACICGGGKFLGCDGKAPPATMACGDALAAVQQTCAGLPFVGLIGDLCSRPNPACVTDCLTRVASCAEIDCSFCTFCDCAPPATPSPFAACLASC
jgi:hypothetical protein